MISCQTQAKLFKMVENGLKVTMDNPQAQDILNEMWEILWETETIRVKPGRQIIR